MAHRANFRQWFLPEFLSVFDIFTPFYTEAIITNRKPEISAEKHMILFFAQVTVDITTILFIFSL